MRTCNVVLTGLALVSLSAYAFAQDEVIAGQNINMVSGTQWPGGDPYLQRQNEATIAVSTRNSLHLMGGSNDYRTVDLPGLPEGKTIGDSWISSYFSITGGGRWTSTLLPGYPQDTSPLGLTSPLRTALDGVGYEATADPVVRAGTHGLFYYSGIAFTRDDAPPSAGFVATYMDLNNDERKSTIGYVGAALFDKNDDGTSFIDKPWIAVDKPRGDAESRTLEVNTEDGVVSQTVDCGKVYVAYARIQGDGSAAIRSQIMVSRSDDCAATFSEPIQVSLPNTINQGAAVAVDPLSGDVQVAWRQFENATLNCTYAGSFWLENPEAWPVSQLELAGETYESDNLEALYPGATGNNGGTPWLVLRELVSAWLNGLAGSGRSAEITEAMAAAEAWLIDFPPGSKPKKDDEKLGNELRKLLQDYNKGKLGPASCEDLAGDGVNELLSGLNPNAIMVVRSSDGGETFSAPVSATPSDYFPFEQGTTEYSFRTTGYPTMIFDGAGRSYIAYSTRGLAIANPDTVGGDARIVVTTSMNGVGWTAGQPIDEPAVSGHQIMPALEFSRGKVFLLYYDFRRDLAGVHERFIVDLNADPTTPRHSTDVRVARADAADVPVFTDSSVASVQTSRYPFLILNDAFDQPFSQQTQFNLLNLPMFKGGTVPFFGDYIDLAAQHFFTDGAGNWEFDTDESRGAPVVHAVWTDNRDVVAPPDGDWTSYVPPGETGGGPSLFDPDQTVAECTPTVADRTQMRNQNIYTSRLTQGLAFALPGNNRPLDAIQRVFVGFVQNMTDEDKIFRLEILNQPPGGRASFDQFSSLPVTTIEEGVERNSSISRSIYVSSTDPSASVEISVVELDGSGTPVPGGLTALSRINSDPTAPDPDAGNILTEEIYTPAIFNPAIFNPAIFNSALLGTDNVGIYSPAIFNPAIFNNPVGDPWDPAFLEAARVSLALLNPAIFNPAIFNPAIFNPAIFNPAIFNPAIFNPAIFNPAIFNPAIFNPAIFNPAIFNPAIFNPAILNQAIFNPAIFNPAIFNSSLVETSIVVKNTGNATAAYSLNLDLEALPEGFLYQVMIYRSYLVPTADGCTVTEELVQEQLVNELVPDVNGNLFSPDSTSFFVAPDDDVIVTLRIIPDPAAEPPGDPSTIDTLVELDLSQSIVPQAVDTQGLANGETQPTPVAVLAPSRTAGGLVDQQQPVINALASPLLIDPLSEQKFAQVITAGLTGWLTGVRLPVACAPSTPDTQLIVEIQGVTAGQPDGTILTTKVVPQADIPQFPPGGAFLRAIQLDNSVLFSAGKQFAIVVRTALPSGPCVIAAGPLSESYPGGNGWVATAPTNVWNETANFAGYGVDLPFQTVVVPGSSGGAGPVGSLYEADWQLPGDGALTVDSATGLEWLDLTRTTNISVADVRTALTGTFEGFCMATPGEVGTFFANAGLVNVATTPDDLASLQDPVQRAIARALQNLWGVTSDEVLPFPFGTSYISLAHVKDLPPNPVNYYRAVIGVNDIEGAVGTRYFPLDLQQPLPTNGSALVRRSGPVSSLYEADWQVPGDGALTVDSTTGLEWLDLTETDNLSFNFDVLPELGAGGTYEGFRLATTAEVGMLFANAGLVNVDTAGTPTGAPGSPNGHDCPAQVAVARELQLLWGLTFTTADSEGINAVVGDGQQLALFCRADLIINDFNNVGTVFAGVCGVNGFTGNGSSQTMGTALVRP